MDNSRTLTRGGSKDSQHSERDTGRAGRVDYSLARKATLAAYRAGHLSKFEICDAHPDLLRAARYAGERIGTSCPICEHGSLELVSYVFSDEFPKRENGRVWTGGDLAPLLAYREVRLYTVEVCRGCSWNHVRSQLLFGSGRQRRARSAAGAQPNRRGRRAST